MGNFASRQAKMDRRCMKAEIDTDPVITGSSICISLIPQKKRIIITVDQSGYEYKLNIASFITEDLMRDHTVIIAEQILRPIAKSLNMDPAEMIIHMQVGDEFHLRTMQSQLRKRWILDNRGIYPFLNYKNNSRWTIDLTDHKYWSSPGPS